MEEPQAAVCAECGAPVPLGRTCKDNFHALLFLEAEVPGGPGTFAHFYAVASYGLQHPASMGLTRESIEGMRTEVEAMLMGDVRIEDVRRHVRDRAARAGRVTRRAGDTVPRWPVEAWPMTVVDVVGSGPDHYCRQVEDWARSVTATLRGVTLD